MIEDEVLIEEIAPEPEKLVPVEPSRILPSVSLDVYAAACGRKHDQMAGFRYWAEAYKLGKRTIPEWEEAYASFMATPVR